MIKKALIALCAIFMILSLSLTSFAESGEEFYEEYDNYEEFEQDYYQSVGILEQEQPNQKQWYTNLSVIPLVFGLAAGGLTVFILFRKHSMAQRHIPEFTHPYALDIKHTVISDENENTL